VMRSTTTPAELPNEGPDWLDDFENGRARVLIRAEPG
jgi:hypothetical protein